MKDYIRYSSGTLTSLRNGYKQDLCNIRWVYVSVDASSITAVFQKI